MADATPEFSDGVLLTGALRIQCGTCGNPFIARLTNCDPDSLPEDVAICPAEGCGARIPIAICVGDDTDALEDEGDEDAPSSTATSEQVL